ncbi:hypothetical protein MTO96_001449 [Rhipicephalus appendiculatus]
MSRVLRGAPRSLLVYFPFQSELKPDRRLDQGESALPCITLPYNACQICAPRELWRGFRSRDEPSPGLVGPVGPAAAPPIAARPLCTAHLLCRRPPNQRSSFRRALATKQPGPNEF